MRRSIVASLKRPDTDHIDLFWLHVWDFTTPLEEIMRGFDDLARAGKVLYLGISDTPAWQVVDVDGDHPAAHRDCELRAGDERLTKAKEFGADVVINSTGMDVRQAIRDLAHGLGADFALETSGAPSAQVEAVRCLRVWGTVAFVGVGAPATLNLGVDVILRQINMFGSFTFSTTILREAARFAVNRNVPADVIFSNRWTLDQADEAYNPFGTKAPGKGVFVL